MTDGPSTEHPLAGPPDFACFQQDAGAGAIRVVIRGELDLATSAVFDRALTDAHPRAILDLGGLTFIDCNSLSVLVLASDRARAAGGRLRLVKRSAAVERLCSLTAIEGRLDPAA